MDQHLILGNWEKVRLKGANRLEYRLYLFNFYQVLSPIFTRLCTFFTFTRFFFCIGTKVCTMQLLALCQKSWCECMIQLWRITILILEKNLIHQGFFCLCVNVIWLKLHPVIFSLESVWKNDFDIVHVLLRAVHRQHVQSAMQRYQAR